MHNFIKRSQVTCLAFVCFKWRSFPFLCEFNWPQLPRSKCAEVNIFIDFLLLFDPTTISRVSLSLSIQLIEDFSKLLSQFKLKLLRSKKFTSCLKMKTKTLKNHGWQAHMCSNVFCLYRSHKMGSRCLFLAT